MIAWLVRRERGPTLTYSAEMDPRMASSEGENPLWSPKTSVVVVWRGAEGALGSAGDVKATESHKSAKSEASREQGGFYDVRTVLATRKRQQQRRAKRVAVVRRIYKCVCPR